MNIDYLKNYIVIAESNNISEASKKLFIAQPSLSNQIKYLEEQYGTILIHRTGRNIRLTKSGKILYEKAKQIMKYYNESFVEIKTLKNKAKGELNIAIPPTVYKELIDKNFQSFSQKFPDVILNIYEANSTSAQNYLDNNICELAITNANISNLEKYNIKDLAKENFKVVLPNNSSLNNLKELTMNDIKDLHFAIPRAYISSLLEHASLHKVNLQIDVTTTTTRGALEIASLKNIAAIVPLPDDEETNLNIKNLILDNFNKYTRKLIWKKEEELSLVAKEFIECLDDIFN